MNPVLEWLLSIGASAAGSAALLGLAGFLFRSKLAHWLNKDLENVKAQHQRDLESYKVSLIAEAERAKATQDVQKALALKMAERKFDAIDQLYRLIAPLHGEVFAGLDAFCVADVDARIAQSDTLITAIVDASNSATLAAPFLESHERACIHQLMSTLAESVTFLRADPCTLTRADVKKRRAQDIELFTSCVQALEEHLTRMLSMA